MKKILILLLLLSGMPMMQAMKTTTTSTSQVGEKNLKFVKDEKVVLSVPIEIAEIISPIFNAQIKSGMKDRYQINVNDYQATTLEIFQNFIILFSKHFSRITKKIPKEQLKNIWGYMKKMLLAKPKIILEFYQFVNQFGITFLEPLVASLLPYVLAQTPEICNFSESPISLSDKGIKSINLLNDYYILPLQPALVQQDVHQLWFTPDNNLIMKKTNGSIVIDQKAEKQLTISVPDKTAVVVSANGSHVALASNYEVKIYTVTNVNPISTITFQERIWLQAISSDGRFFLVRKQNGDITLFNTQTNSEQVLLTQKGGSNINSIISADNIIIIWINYVNDKGKLLRFRINEQGIASEVKSMDSENRLASVVVSRTNKYIVVAKFGGKIEFYDKESNLVNQRKQSFLSQGFIAIHPDEQHIALIKNDHQIGFYAIKTLKEVGLIDNASVNVDSVIKFSNDGKYFVVISESTARIFPLGLEEFIPEQALAIATLIEIAKDISLGQNLAGRISGLKIMSTSGFLSKGGWLYKAIMTLPFQVCDQFYNLYPVAKELIEKAREQTEAERQMEQEEETPATTTTTTTATTNPPTPPSPSTMEDVD